MDKFKARGLFNEVLGDDRGLAVLKEIKDLCFAEKSTLSKGSNGELDVNMMLVKEGMRAAWLKIEELLTEETKKNLSLI